MRTFGKISIGIIVLLLIAACAPSAPTPTTASSKPAVAPTSAAGAEVAAQPTTIAASAAAATPAAKIKRGGTLVYALASGQDPNSWDPVLHHSADGMHELPIFEAPLRWDLVDPKTGKHELRGELAESWEITDPKTIVMKLRKGIKFHDGSDFNAEVLKWNFDRVKTHPKSTGKGYISSVNSMDVVDPYTVKINLANPSAVTLLNFTKAAGGSGSSWSNQVSKQAVEAMGEEAFAMKPIGTGTMKMTEMLRDNQTVFKKWEGYWKKGADGQALPYLDGITARVIADNSVVLVEMKAGTVHLTSFVQPKDFAGVKSNPELKLIPLPWSSGRRLVGFNQQKGPFANNLKLRQAALYSIDQDSMARVMAFGEGGRNPYIYWVPGNPGYDASLPKYEFNLDKAKQLMKDAGLADGTDVVLSVSNSPASRQEGEMIQSMWTKAGIRTTLEMADTTAIRAKQKAGNFDVAHWGMTSSLDISHYSRGLLCDGSANWSSYCNPELDKCMKEGDTFYEPEKRAEVYRRCQKIIYEDALIGGTFLIPPAVVQRKEVKGVRFQAYAMDLQEVWLDK